MIENISGKEEKAGKEENEVGEEGSEVVNKITAVFGSCNDVLMFQKILKGERNIIINNKIKPLGGQLILDRILHSTKKPYNIGLKIKTNLFISKDKIRTYYEG